MDPPTPAHWVCPGWGDPPCVPPPYPQIWGQNWGFGGSLVFFWAERRRFLCQAPRMVGAAGHWGVGGNHSPLPTKIPPIFRCPFFFLLLFFPLSSWVLSCPSGVAKAPEAPAGGALGAPPLHYCPGPPAAALWGGCTPQLPPQCCRGGWAEAGAGRGNPTGGSRGEGGAQLRGGTREWFYHLFKPPPPPKFRFVNFFLPQAEAEGGCGPGGGRQGRPGPPKLIYIYIYI